MNARIRSSEGSSRVSGQRESRASSTSGRSRRGGRCWGESDIAPESRDASLDAEIRHVDDRAVADRLVDLVGGRVGLVGEEARALAGVAEQLRDLGAQPRWRCRGRGAPGRCRPARSGRRRTTAGSPQSGGRADRTRPPRRRPGRPRSAAAARRRARRPVGALPGVASGLLVRVGHERVVPGGDQVLLVRRRPDAAAPRPEPARPARRARRAGCAGRPSCAPPVCSAIVLAEDLHRRQRAVGAAVTGSSRSSSASASEPHGLVGHRQQEGRVGRRTSRSASRVPSTRSPSRTAANQHGTPSGQATPASRVVGDPAGDAGDHGAEHRLLGEVVGGDVEERDGVVEESQLHAGTLRPGTGSPPPDSGGAASRPARVACPP